MPPHPTPDLKPRQRHRALAELNAAIAEVERHRDDHLAAIDRLAAAGKDPARVLALLRITDDYLARLRASRRVLLSGELPEDERGAPNGRGRVPAGVTG